MEAIKTLLRAAVYLIAIGMPVVLLFSACAIVVSGRCSARERSDPAHPDYEGPRP